MSDLSTKCTVEIPIREDLNEFIKFQGTKLIDDGIHKYIESQRKDDFSSGRLNIFRSNISPDIDNQISRKFQKDVLSHICKLPDSSHILRDQKIPVDGSRPYCSLKQLCSIGVFVKRVYSRSPDRLESPDREVSPTELEIQKKVCTEIAFESQIPWNKKEPYHKCFYNVTNQELVCNSRGLNHWHYLDCICNSFRISDKTILKDTNIHLEKYDFDVNKFVPWRNEIGEIIFTKENPNTFGNSIDAHIKVGTTKITNLFGILNFDVEFLWLAIDNVYYCPLGQSTQGPHICYVTGCDHPLSGGFTGCSLTGLELRDRNGSWEIDTKHYIKTSVEIRESSTNNDCKSAFKNKPKHVNSGVSTEELRKMGDSFYDAIDQFTNPEELARFEEKMKSTSSTRSIVEKALRKQMKDKLFDIGTEQSIKMAKSGHFSLYKSYVLESYFTINKILKYGERPKTAMLINMEKIVNNNLQMLKYDPNASSSSDGKQITVKQDKITFVLPDKELTRKRFVPDSFIVVKNGSKRQKTSSQALIEVDKNHALSVYNPMTTLEDDIVFNEIKATIDESDIQKVLEAKIIELTEKTVKFWALLRQRTKHGREFPNRFNFHLFIYAFLYLLRDGLIINTESPGFVGENVCFFERDIFLKNALPHDIGDLKKLNIVSHGKKDAAIVYKNIKSAISEFIDSKGDYTYIHPDLQENLDFSIDSKDFSPSIWISLHKKKNIN